MNRINDTIKLKSDLKKSIDIINQSTKTSYIITIIYMCKSAKPLQFLCHETGKNFFRSTPFGHVFSQYLYLILYEETVEQAKLGL